MRKTLELDFRTIQAELRNRPVIRSSEAWGPTEDIFKTKHHQYRRINDSTLLHILDFEAVQPYAIDTSRKNFVCIQIILTGAYSRLAGDYVDTVDSASIQITNFPRSITEARAGERLRGILIVVERPYLVEHFGLNLDRIPAAYRPIFASDLGMVQAMKVPAVSSVRISSEQILSCKYQEPLRSIYFTNKATEIICDIVYQLNSMLPSRTRVAQAPSVFHAIEAAAAIYGRELHRPPTLEQLAVRVGVNRNVLVSGFVDNFGVTPHAFCLNLRMEEAQNFLRNSSMSISEVARRVGYGGYASFSRAFSEHFGHAPSLVKNDRNVAIASSGPIAFAADAQHGD
ncbi:MAG: AraC family transcriptional regulator [Phyllobacterium sp.]|uniref:helix-turn-helix transcriptional regulator n=1 Tax=Phyllobacterium sp. TaxID=1871046 RepID=UPI0030F1E7FD